MDKKPKPIKFPEDESVHDNTIEWWYFNGHLKDDIGNEYSFMNCLFKVDVKKVKIPFLSKVPFSKAYFSHSIISDINKKIFNHRITPLSIISDDSFSKPLLYINYVNPTVVNNYTNCVIEQTDKSSYHVKNEDIDLKLISTKKPLLEGGNGFLDLKSSTTYYYSLTNLKTKGRIKIKNEWINVTGISWMDHQWADKGYSKDIKDQWDWFSIQLDNHTELVCAVYRDGKTKTSYAGISYANDRQEHFEKIEVVPSKECWISPKSKAIYPQSWTIKIPAKKIELNLKTKIENQEMLFGSINYWEGPLAVEGVFNGKKVKGVGFMELFGYPSKYSNIKFARDEIEEAINLFLLRGKNKI